MGVYPASLCRVRSSWEAGPGKQVKAPAAGCLLPTREADKTHSNESVSNIVIYKVKCQGNTQVQGKGLKGSGVQGGNRWSWSEKLAP